MFNSEKDFLSLFGWNDFFESHVSDLFSSSLIPARVICEERGLYRVQAGINSVMWANISGRMQFNAKSRADYPAVGDWVMVEVPLQSDRGVIHNIVPRKSIIQRKQIGENSDIQILSTNVDYVFITTSLNEDLNFRRIDRYLALAWEAGSTPIILLTKSDLCPEETAGIVKSVQEEFPHVPVHALSHTQFEEAVILSDYIKKGKTSVFLGSSGVGKSTLINYLIGSEELETQEIRQNDGKGRHTTTSRNLYVSRFGGLVIDTPGMRELQLSEHSEGVKTHFSEIEELIKNCKFGDCQHLSEPGCAIKRALEDGSLAEERWKSYQKLEAEIRHAQRKQNKALAAEDRKAWKKIRIEGKERSQAKRRIKHE